MEKKDIKFLHGKGHICRYCDLGYRDVCHAVNHIRDFAKEEKDINLMDVQIFDCSFFIFNEYVYGNKEEEYRFLGGWGVKSDIARTVIKIENVNTHEFRGRFEGEKFNYVFQYKDVKEIKEGK